MSQPTRVLIADDSAHARNGLRALLATWPEIAVVGEAANGQDAVRLVAEYRPDIVLMDLHMPVLDGVQATQLIKQQWPAVTVVVLTVYAVEQSAALAAGADAFLLKGGTPERLLGALGVDIADGQL
jgi:DNA-binding NarL/FixJ family response regulator